MDSREIATFIEKNQDKFINSMTGVNKDMYKSILGIILDNTHKGIFSIPDSQLATIEDQIYEAIKSSDYNKITTQFLQTFQLIESHIIQEQADLNHIKAVQIKELFKQSGGKKILQQRIISDLGKGAVQNTVVKSMADLIRNEAIFDKTSKEVVKLLSAKIEDGDPMKRYVRQVANDALNQYDGALNQEVKDKYGLTKLKFIGNLVVDSRPFCTHLINQYNGRLEEAQLKTVLADYCPAGIPSDSQITVVDIKNKSHISKKGAGMIEGTVLTNFSIYRGGYECRHRAVWVRMF